MNLCNLRMKRPVTLEDLKGDSPALNDSFNRLKEEVKAVARDKEEEILLLTERVLDEFIEFQVRKALEEMQSDNREESVGSVNIKLDLDAIDMKNVTKIKEEPVDSVYSKLDLDAIDKKNVTKIKEGSVESVHSQRDLDAIDKNITKIKEEDA